MRPHTLLAPARWSSLAADSLPPLSWLSRVSKPVEIQQLVRALHAAHKALSGGSKAGGGEERKDKQ